MPIWTLASGDSETGSVLHRLFGELVYAMGSRIDFEKAPLIKPCTVVLNVRAVNPTLGVLPNDTSARRADNEFWSSYSVDFPAFLAGDVARKLEVIAEALGGAADQIPKTIMSDDVRRDLKKAAIAAAAQLASEADRNRT